MSFLDYLAQSGWRGPLSEIQGLIEAFCPPSRVGDEIYVDLTVDEFDVVGGSRIGLVFSPQHLQRSMESGGDRGPLLGQLVECGLCTEAESRSLQAWALREKGRDGRFGPVVVERWLDVKIVWEPGRRLGAKAYLGVSQRPALPFD